MEARRNTTTIKKRDTYSWTPSQTGLAKALFGRPLRLQVAEWIMAADWREFYLSEIQADMSTRHRAAPSGVRAELLTMRDHGLLVTSNRDRRLYFTPIESKVWDAFRAAIEAVKAEG